MGKTDRAGRESEKREGKGSRSQMTVTPCGRKLSEVAKWVEERLLAAN